VRAGYAEAAEGLGVTMSEPTILIVDDDTLSRALLTDLLKDTGCKLLQAADGDQALEALEANRPDVMLLDLFMPNRSGLEVLQQLNEVSPNTRTLVLSSMDAEAVIQTALSAGARGFIAKPFHPFQVVMAVRNLLGA
jgi:two-component system chemotaxis response regulator CheY